MKNNYREIIVKDSRSQNMVERLLSVPSESRLLRQRWMLLASGGALLRLDSSREAAEPSERVEKA